VVTTGNGFLFDAMAALVSGILGGMAPPKVHLAAAPFTPSPTLDLTTLTEATYDGYAAKAITGWGAAHVDQYGQVLVIPSIAIEFTPTGSMISNTIYGYWIPDTDGNMICCDVFNPGIILDGVQTTLSFVPGVAIGPYKYATVILP
jgi:hypothetical protein